MTTRELIYAVLAALGVLLPVYYNLQYMNAVGNLLVDFFTVPMQNAVTASLLFDILIAFAVFNVLLFAEGRFRFKPRTPRRTTATPHTTTRLSDSQTLFG